MHFDYVIVGGGSAGCCLAGRLSEDPDKTVCISGDVVEVAPPLDPSGNTALVGARKTVVRILF